VQNNSIKALKNQYASGTQQQSYSAIQKLENVQWIIISLHIGDPRGM